MNSGDRSTRAIDALLRLRALRRREAKTRVQLKGMEVALLRRELGSIRKRREDVLRRGGASVLRERLLLDALMRIAIEKRNRLETRQREAEILLGEYREARSRHEAVESLGERRRAEREALRARREEEAATDLAGSRGARHRYEEDPCED